LRPIVAGVIMAGAVTAVRLLLPETMHEVLRTALLVVTGGVVYPMVLLVAFRPLALELRGVFGSRRQAA
jgi:hypothetical protein